MAQLKTGQYKGIFFDRYGNKIRKTHHVIADSYTKAVRKCRLYAKFCGFHSFRIDRAIYNSLDRMS